MSTPLTPRERAARRALIKAHHPDRGGDPARFVELLEELDRPAAGAARPEVRATRSRQRRRRQVLRALQQRLPRRLPGARRYASY